MEKRKPLPLRNSQANGETGQVNESCKWHISCSEKMMFQALHREDNVSEKPSERTQTLSKNLSCEATTFTPGALIPNTQGFHKTLLSVLSVLLHGTLF